MRAVLWTLLGNLGALGACTVTEGSTDLFRAERDAEVLAPLPPPADATAPQTASPPEKDAENAGAAGFELDAYKTEQEKADGDALKRADLQALRAELGVTGEPPPADPAPPTPAMPPAAPARWTPASPVAFGWGLRLVSTVDAASPPRAILGLPDGREEVVKAGDLLPDVGVVVLAVGQGVVQVGLVTAEGDHARVESVFLQAMFSGAPTPPARTAPAGIEVTPGVTPRPR